MILLVVYFLCFASADSYRSSINTANRFRCSSLNSDNLGSYEKMLQQARQKKVQNINKSTQSSSSSVEISRDFNPQQTVKETVKQVKITPVVITKPKSEFPFDDELYEHLKYVINKLTSKIKSDISLNEEELVKFERSVEVILADAKHEEIEQVEVEDVVYQQVDFEKEEIIEVNQLQRQQLQQRQLLSTPIETTATTTTIATTTSNTQKTNNNNQNSKQNQPFQQFNGMKSTWQVPGIEQMDSEEFYKKLNQRNAEVRMQRRKEGFGIEESDAYFKSLSRKKQ
jgi:hypothetical protein